MLISQRIRKRELEKNILVAVFIQHFTVIAIPLFQWEKQSVNNKSLTLNYNIEMLISQGLESGKGEIIFYIPYLIYRASISNLEI